MSENSVVLSLTLENCIKISKWKVKEGTIVSVGRIILLYDPSPGNGKPEVQKLKATAVGTVRKLLAKEGTVVQPGHPLLELEKCTHPTVMKDMCAECGADLRNEGAPNLNVASIPMVHSIPELKVNAEQAQILGKADESRLLATQKLVLLVDLDQTLIHTTNDNIPPNLKDVFHFRLHGSRSPWHHTRLRPGTNKFLEEMSKLYELHICTFGSRMYAHMIAKFLDPNGLYFSHRILSRDECVSANSKTANLKALFPCGDEMVCIIDDREDVWNFAPNLIHVKPYHFFQHTGDINAPPGLSKQENDDKGDYDFNCLGDGKKGKDILRPNLPGNQESHLDVVNQKDKKAALEVSVNKNSDPLEERQNETAKEVEETASEDKQEKDASLVNDDELVSDVSEESNVQVLNSEPTQENVKEENSNDPNLENDICIEALKGSETNVQKQEDSELVKVEKSLDESQSDEENAEDVSVVQNVKEIAENVSEPLNDAEKAEDGSVVQNVKEIAENVSEPLNDAEKAEDVSEPQNDEENAEDMPKPQNDEGNAGDDMLEPPEPGILDESVSDPNPEVAETVTTIGRKNADKADEIEVPDHDDYLLYLEEILKRIHMEFYDQRAKGEKPDMKDIIPAVRKKVLKDTNLVFSGLVPNNIPLERSRAYQVAVSLGANITQDLKKNTTHLVAVRPGTAKVNSARRMKNVFMVTADWLWVSAERWERVDEKVFPLGRNRAGTRHPPAHCGSPEHTPVARENPSEPSTSSGRSRTASGRFMDTINPLLSFSSADIADMDQEVDDIFRESESDGEEKEKPPVAPEMEMESDEEVKPIVLPAVKTKGENEDSESSSSSADSLSGEHPHGWGKHDLKRKRLHHKPGTGTATESEGDEEADDMPSAKFRRGEALPSDLDLGENESDSPGSEDPPDEMDDGDWNMMGAALEREFLS